jgi:hypothetical protein
MHRVFYLSMFHFFNKQFPISYYLKPVQLPWTLQLI